MSDNQYVKIKVSVPAYKRLKAIAKSDEKYKGRGIVGVLDYIFLGKFTTSGSGHPRAKFTPKQKT